MPRIQTIVNEVVPSSPSPVRSTAASFGGLQGRALQGLGVSIAQTDQAVQKRQEQKEISQVQAQLAERQATLTNQLAEELRGADPNDDAVASRFTERVNTSFDDLFNGVSTGRSRQFLTESVAKIKAQFNVSAAAGQAELAGVAAVSNYTMAINEYSTTLINDPSSLGLILDQINQAGDAMVATGGLPREAEIKLRAQAHRDAALSAVAGWNDINPAIARDLINKGTFDALVDGPTKAQMLGQVDTAERALRVDAELQRAAQKRALEAAQDAKQVEFLSRIITNDPSQWPSAKEIVSSDLQPSQAEHFLRITGQLGEGGGVGTNAALRDELFQRSLLPPGDPRRVTPDEILSNVFRGIQPEDANYLLKVNAGGMTPAGQAENTMADNFWRASRAFLKTTTDINQVDELGEAAFNNFFIWASTEAQRLIESGVSPTEVYDVNGPLAKKWTDFKRSFSESLKFNMELGRFKRGEIKTPPALPSVPTLTLGGEPVEATPKTGRSPEELDRLLENLK